MIQSLTANELMEERGIKLGLERMEELMHLLDDPQDKLKFIHVAGTNGKGSTCSFISAILSANGYRVGMYTSPAVEDVREQYAINGEWISKEDYAAYVTMLYSLLLGRTSEQANNEPSFKLSDIVSSGNAGLMKDDMPTQFELETALAFCYFSDMDCDYVVLETGMGGRGDATNIVKTTVLTVFTSISEDHLGMIGNNLEEIAYTKAGIIKQGIPVVMTVNDPCVCKVIQDECVKLNAPLYLTGQDTEDDMRKITINTSGSYQRQNAHLAVKATEVLGQYEKSLIIDEDKVKEAIASVHMPYRMEKIYDAPLFYLDGAHNPDAAGQLRKTVEEMIEGYSMIFIMGVFKDKDYRQIIRIMAPLADHIITVQTPYTTRALPAEDLRDCILDESRRDSGSSYPGEGDIEALSIEEAVRRSKELSAACTEKGRKSCILAFGSLSYLKYIASTI